MTDYLTVIEVLPSMRIRSRGMAALMACGTWGLLEAALFRPQTGYYEDEIKQAAALWESLAPNHPFVDGNKRTAFAVTYTFLAINGLRITAAPDDIFRFTMDGLVAGEFRFDRIENWIHENTSK